ncbi:MAG TPA: hypothetical protein VJ835_11645, partial [Fimbriimonadaceae bacterium]|nr:hypothetical protein [Fimbriimonadaceae bacterium]
RKGATDSTLCGRYDGLGALHGATNARVATTESLKSNSFRARMGFPDGSTFEAEDFYKRFPRMRAKSAPFLKDMPPNPWVSFAMQK